VLDRQPSFSAGAYYVENGLMPHGPEGYGFFPPKGGIMEVYVPAGVERMVSASFGRTHLQLIKDLA
jgi:hypothetical protein